PAPIAVPAAPKSGGLSMQTVSSQPNSRRIAPLAILPVFFDLKEKRAVVIGGSEAAAWKIELLVAAGARVEIFAEEICDELAQLAGSHSPVSASGRSTLSPRGKGVEASAEPFFSLSGRRWSEGPNEGDAATAPNITLHNRPWAPADLTGAAFAVADIDDSAAALALLASS